MTLSKVIERAIFLKSKRILCLPVTELSKLYFLTPGLAARRTAGKKADI